MRLPDSVQFNPHLHPIVWDETIGQPYLNHKSHMRLYPDGTQITIHHHFNNDTGREGWARDYNIGVFSSSDEFVYYPHDGGRRHFGLVTDDGRSVVKAWLNQDGQQMMLCDFDHMVAVPLTTNWKEARYGVARYPHRLGRPVGTGVFSLSVPDRKLGPKVREYAERVKSACTLILKMQNEDVRSHKMIHNHKVLQELQSMPDPLAYLGNKSPSELRFIHINIERRWKELGRVIETHQSLNIRRL